MSRTMRLLLFLFYFIPSVPCDLFLYPTLLNLHSFYTLMRLTTFILKHHGLSNLSSILRNLLVSDYNVQYCINLETFNAPVKAKLFKPPGKAGGLPIVITPFS
jgi:hypothetical protein